jgi:hypothetical protein
MSTIPAIDIEQCAPAGDEVRESVSSATRIKNWRVIHACEYVRHVLPVVESQVSAGMRPYIVTPTGAGAAELYLSSQQADQPANLSLLRAWHDVRNWRKSLLECDPENTADVLHAHSFAAGMAAVRGFSCVVYDLDACIEDWAIASGQCEHGSWMGRSFRVAEQFILSRAEAVVVHSLAMKSAVAERGAPREAIFFVPDPVEFDPESGTLGKAAMVETRNNAIAKKYDEAYRYAVLRKKARSSGPNITTLRPVVSANW